MQDIRNIAIIAHVDHGKTTLVDKILAQLQLLRTAEAEQDCLLDSNDLERERGITILSKNISVRYGETKINLIDTPGHSDFGGQVERVLHMADGVLLLVDSAEGPMPQTRFVLGKALEAGLHPIVVINKIDKADARPEAVIDAVFDLFVELHATDAQLDFPILYASGRDGWATTDLDAPSTTIVPLLDAMIEHVPAPTLNEGPAQLQITSIDYSEYLGRIGIGRVHRGTVSRGFVAVCKPNGDSRQGEIRQLHVFEGLGKVEADSVIYGEICAVAGITDIDIGDTICPTTNPEALPAITMDEPTLTMVFRVNDSPFYGRAGKFLSSRHLRERLLRAAEADVALHITEMDGDAFEIGGRGVLHFSILLETMRREGYELAVSRPHVIFHAGDKGREEPIEILNVEVPSESAGKVIELVGMRRGEMVSMDPQGDRQLLVFRVPTRGLIGLRSKLLTATAGEAIINHLFDAYEPYRGAIPGRQNGVLISMDQGPAAAYAIDALQARGTFFVGPTQDIYEGMIVGENSRDGDLVVNLQKGKQLTNVRASGTDRSLKIAPPIRFSLEEALEYIEDDELLEITPENIRLRKRHLTENGRKRNRKSIG